MMPRRLSFRICALTAAYALALHALAASMVFAGQPLANSAFGSATCISESTGNNTAGGQGQDQNHGRSACVLHCLAFNGPDAWTPPAASVLAKFTPAEFRVISLAPVELPGGVRFKTPQSPRAPPRA